MNKIIKRKVVSGKKTATSTGFPTANVRHYKYDKMKPGVWATKITHSNKTYFGATYIGKNHIETYIFDYKSKLYGKIIKIEFIKHIRLPKKFNKKSVLTSQIRQDIKKIKSIRLLNF